VDDKVGPVVYRKACLGQEALNFCWGNMTVPDPDMIAIVEYAQQDL
jgi:hypothetical protein